MPSSDLLLLEVRSRPLRLLLMRRARIDEIDRREGGLVPFQLYPPSAVTLVHRTMRLDERSISKSDQVGTALAAGNRPDDVIGLRPRRYGVGQGGIRRLMGQVPLAGEESQERPALGGDVVADRPPQHRVAGFERVEHRPLRGLTGHVERHLEAKVGQRSEVIRQNDADHRSVCASTDNTAGRSRTIGVQVLPASTDAYTCPPVVPKYTPHASSESTAIASRSTLT